MIDSPSSNYEKYFGSPERVALTFEMIDTVHNDSMDNETGKYEANITDCACETMGFPEDVPFIGHRVLEWLYNVPALYMNEKWVRDCAFDCECYPRERAFKELEGADD